MAIFREERYNHAILQDGYFVARLLDAQEAQTCRQEVTAILGERPVETVPEVIFNSAMAPDRAEKIWAGLKPPVHKIDELLADYVAYDGAVTARNGGSRGLPIHTHPSLASKIFDPNVTIFLALDDSDEKSAGFLVIPGSHRVHRHYLPDRSEAADRLVLDSLKENLAVSVNLKAGEALFMDHTILHSAYDNQTEQTRFRLVFSAMPEGARWSNIQQSVDGNLDMYEFESRRVLCDFERNVRPPTGTISRVGMAPFREETLTYEEYTALIESGNKIAPGYDPIDEIRAANKPLQQSFVGSLLNLLKSMSRNP